jgi:hypothetical protein
MNAHDKLMLDKTSKALAPQPTDVPAKQTKHKIRAGKRIRQMQAQPVRQITYKERHGWDDRGNLL